MGKWLTTRVYAIANYGEIHRLAYKAFQTVVCARQTDKETLVRWLELEVLRTWPEKRAESKMLRHLQLEGGKVGGWETRRRGRSGTVGEECKDTEDRRY